MDAPAVTAARAPARTASAGRGRALGLVLTAGGARGAYQAGVLQRISEIPALRDQPLPFPIVTGASAGAINGAMLVATSADFGAGCAELSHLWSGLRFADVARVDPLAMARNAAGFAWDALTGRLFGAGHTQALLDATPLRAYIARYLPLAGIAEAVAQRRIRALAITATGYHTGRAFTFVEGAAGLPLWRKRRRVALRTQIGVGHVCASAAIPLVFPPVPLQLDGGQVWFGDGAMRLTAPLSPAIRLGSDRLLAIGIRCEATAEKLLLAESHGEVGAAAPRRPPLSQICGVLMNALFLDHLDADLDHLQRMNELIGAYQRSNRGLPEAPPVSEPMRLVQPLVISPSVDFAIVAQTLVHRLPGSVRLLLDALGRPDAESADLVSYLLFDAAYTRELIRIGYDDAGRRADEIEAFLQLRAARRSAARRAR
jgi:NTE family protein